MVGGNFYFESLKNRYADLFPDLPLPPPLPPGFERQSRCLTYRGVPDEVTSPVTIAEVTMNIADTSMRLGPKRTELGMGQLTGCWNIGGGVGILIN